MRLELARRTRCKIKLWKSPTSKLFKSGYFLHPQPPTRPSHAIGGRRSFPGSLIVSPLPLISLISRAFHPHNRQVNTKCITLPHRPSRLSVDKPNLNLNYELRCISQFHSMYLDSIPTSLSEQFWVPCTLGVWKCVVLHILLETVAIIFLSIEKHHCSTYE